jgi:Ca2+:H+ antiporter
VTWLRWLLLALPVSWALAALHGPPLAVFLVSGLGVVPLAAIMGEATETLAHRTGPTVGGLLNATFGNAAELILAIVALRAGLIDLVKASLTGSILGNLLLILGLSLVAGGLGHPTLKFNRTAAGMSGAMLLLAVVGLVMPALFSSTHPAATQATTVHLSEGVAMVLGGTYVLGLVFTLVTHRELFGSGGGASAHGPVASTRVGRAGAVLAGATVLVAVQSEILVHAVEQVVTHLGWSEFFLGLMVIPLVGNAAEHASAVVAARRGHTDLALTIALGSSTQIALFVAPLLVLAGVMVGQPMHLGFTGFEVVALGLASLIVTVIALDGESHWFEGVQLLAVYAILAIAAWFV